ncbi:hypothetical protein LOD99_11152 [Oopsacas minuta]|uniref:PHD-type domain-containing protein n=1 Tax=Oopsacas minuta TaxID=111878 RepID=A0AAV7K9A5_9METZ|nr:hypothetical protein LOD99_11152 [Oopsacas minuta]
MPRMTNANAREKLSSTLKQFRSITGESIGVVFTWRGKLATMGTENFQNLIHSQKNEFCGSIVGSHRETDTEKFNQDKEIIDQLDGDLESYSVPTLRRLVSWITKRSVGKNVSFWNDPSLVPSFWPRDVEYKNIKHSNKKTLCRIIRGYRRNDNLGEPVNGVRDRSPHISPQKTPRVVPKKFKKSPEKKNIFEHHPVMTPITSLPHSSSYIPVSDVDSSCSEGFLPGFRQFEHSTDDVIVPTSTPSLVSQLGITPLQPIFEFSPILNQKDRDQSLLELSTKNTFLTDTCMNTFSNRQFIRAPRPSMQIHHDGGLHWVCSSADVEGNATVYDSLATGRTSGELDIQLALLYGLSAGKMTVTFAPIQQQRGGADCRLFAAAVCRAIANGDDPQHIRWKQNWMRSYLSDCFKTETLKPFPATESKQLRTKILTSSRSEFKIELWCLCNLPEFASSNMIECSKCRQWFHKPCVGLIDDSNDVECFSCPQCSPHRSSLP